MYKLFTSASGVPMIIKIIDNSYTYISMCQDNVDYQEYLQWLDGYEKQHNPDGTINWVKTSDGNEPLPADSGE